MLQIVKETDKALLRKDNKRTGLQKTEDED